MTKHSCDYCGMGYSCPNKSKKDCINEIKPCINGESESGNDLWFCCNPCLNSYENEVNEDDLEEEIEGGEYESESDDEDYGDEEY
jgi:hypothetical protein